MFNPQVFYQTWNKIPWDFRRFCRTKITLHHPIIGWCRSLRKVLTKPCWSRNLAKWPQQTPVMAVVDGLFFPPPPGASIFHREMAVSKHRIFVFFGGVGTKKNMEELYVFFLGVGHKIGWKWYVFFLGGSCIIISYQRLWKSFRICRELTTT